MLLRNYPFSNSASIPVFNFAQYFLTPFERLYRVIDEYVLKDKGVFFVSVLLNSCPGATFCFTYVFIFTNKRALSILYLASFVNINT